MPGGVEKRGLQRRAREGEWEEHVSCGQEPGRTAVGQRMAPSYTV